MPYQQQTKTFLTEKEWRDLALRHADSDWSCNESTDGYLQAVKALVTDALTKALTEATEKPQVHGGTRLLGGIRLLLGYPGWGWSMNGLASFKSGKMWFLGFSRQLPSESKQDESKHTL